MKRTALAILAVYAAWSLLDMLVHGVLLDQAYHATAHLWRPMPEMKMGLMQAVCFGIAIIFVSVYATMVGHHSLRRGLAYGTLWGTALGLSMGYGSYSFMPISSSLAFAWFATSVFEGVVAGLIVGSVVKSCQCTHPV
ncbi:MAG: hypothetical protein HYV02_01245 [Deltaproteobacteria bacterium]|nr:hypothetical protein [Deltaproteobacteria bacterium]